MDIVVWKNSIMYILLLMFLFCFNSLNGSFWGPIRVITNVDMRKVVHWDVDIGADIDNPLALIGWVNQASSSKDSSISYMLNQLLDARNWTNQTKVGKTRETAVDNVVPTEIAVSLSLNSFVSDQTNAAVIWSPIGQVSGVTEDNLIIKSFNIKSDVGSLVVIDDCLDTKKEPDASGLGIAINDRIFGASCYILPSGGGGNEAVFSLTKKNTACWKGGDFSLETTDRGQAENLNISIIKSPGGFGSISYLVYKFRKKDLFSFEKGVTKALRGIDGVWDDPVKNTFKLTSSSKSSKDDDRGQGLANDNVGDAIALWERHHSDDRFSIHMSRTTNGGDSWSSEFMIDSTFSQVETYAQVAMSPGGRSVIGYILQKSDGTNQIRVVFDPLETDTFSPQIVSTRPTKPTFLSVSIDAFGNVGMSWVEEDVLKTTFFIKSIGKWFDPVTTYQFMNFTSQSFPTLKMHPNGEAVLAFVDGVKLYTTFISPLPIRMNNVASELLTHGFVEKDATDPKFSPSCERIIREIPATYEQYSNRHPMQSEFFNIVTWPAQSGIRSYLLCRNGSVIVEVDNDTTTYIDHNRSNANPDTYTVKLLNSNGSPFCNILTWDPFFGVTGYKIFKNGILIDQTDPSTTSYTDCDTIPSIDDCQNCPCYECI